MAKQLPLLEKVTLVGGQVIWAHSPEICKGRTCCIHNPSDHHMKDWPQNWRDDRRIMERICRCGCGHPDFDDAAYRASKGDTDTLHGCCGCCAEEADEEEYEYREKK